MALFKQIKLTTPESVELELTLAGIGSRALALTIDYCLLLLAQTLLLFLLGLFSEQLLNYLEQLQVNSNGLELWVVSIALLGFFGLYAGYFVVFETIWQGQSPGKRLAQIRVIRDNGQPVRLSQSALRALLRPVDDFLFIGMFLISLSQQEKRLGDWLAGTLVVREARPQAQRPATLSDVAQTLAAELPSLTDLSQLQPDDFAVVSEYLQRRQAMSSQARRELSLKLAREIRSIIKLAEIPTGLTSDQFLEAVYMAYQQQFSIE
ncbi:MAG: RDD family protein [Pegethrix bostrychoides GSE-TBD4-15B]|jgi:uncharacterized RDD family membrane protein YckC|uniref:RDD family protein n=1 Tax=Pegethrix bostrychoides GSE-TBD4-15B TaxID=2839662 RepID=A0A951PC52_9CYAN|nr:RDD family protein [Pegethrix bostrychoides GSE-TBD4-15B]